MMNELKDVVTVEGHMVAHFPDGAGHSPEKCRNNIIIDHDKETITYRLMTKPASEGGEGCQVTCEIRVALHKIKFFQSKYPCRENALTITKLEEALMWQEARTKNRVARNVEGKNEL